MTNNSTTRRSAIKKSVLAGLGIFSTGSLPQASASNDDEFTFSTNSVKQIYPATITWSKWIGTSSVTIEYTKTIHDNSTYIHKFKASCSVSTQGKKPWFGWEKSENISKFSLKLLNLEPDDASLLTPNQSDRRLVASTSSEENLDYDDGLEAVARACVSSLNVYTQIAITADSVISELNGDNIEAGPISEDDYQGYNYRWDAIDGSVFNPEHGKDESASVEFYIESDDQFFDVQVESTMTCAPPSGPSGNSQGNWTSKLRTTQSLVKDPMGTSLDETSSTNNATDTISRDDIDDPVIKEKLNGDELKEVVLPVGKNEPVDYNQQSASRKNSSN